MVSREYRHFRETKRCLGADKSFQKRGNVTRRRNGAAERRLQTLIKCHSSATRFVSHPPTMRSLARIFAPLVSARSYTRHARGVHALFHAGAAKTYLPFPAGQAPWFVAENQARVESRVAIKALAARLSVFPTCSTLLSLLSFPLSLYLSLSLPVIVSPPPVIRCCCCTRDVAVLISTGLACLHVLSISVFLFFREIAEQKHCEETDRSFRHFIGLVIGVFHYGRELWFN